MPDPAEQLARLHQAGFEIRTFDRYPRAVVIVRGNCIALYEPQAEGLKRIGQAGWRIGDAIAVLVERNGKRFYQAKNEIVQANRERLQAVRDFEADVSRMLLSTA